MANKHCCVSCGKEMNDEKNNYYYSDKTWFSMGYKVPYCKDCIRKIYDEYYTGFRRRGFLDADKLAIRRVCMACNVYYCDKAYELAKNTKDKNSRTTMIDSYFNKINLKQFRIGNKAKTYDHTLLEDRAEMERLGLQETSNKITMNEGENNSPLPEEQISISRKTKEFFGKGFTDEDYAFLQKEYDDWISRHECNTKPQEMLFKRLCFIQLKINRAETNGLDTKDLDKELRSYLDSAKLQPKQNSGDTTSDTQTFGTLLEKWEQTKPLPEIDEELRDVDNIGVVIDVFFRGHLAKMMGLKNGLSNLYDRYMKKYTVTKPEYNDDEDGEALFDAIFGNSSAMLDD